MQNKLLFSIVSLILIFVFSFVDAFAGPANPRLVEITQPDGSVFKSRLRGDEFQAWRETEDKYSIIKNSKTGFWEYAILDTSTGTLIPSGNIVTPHALPPLSLEKNIMPARDVQRAQSQAEFLKKAFEKRKGTYIQGTKEQAAYRTQSITPVSGDKKTLFILVNFSDRRLQTTASDWATTLFNTAASAKSLRNYFIDNSFSLVDIIPINHSQTDSPAGIVTVDLAVAHPDCGKDITITDESVWVNAALAQAAAYIDFSALDTNGDGLIDPDEACIYFILAGYEDSSSDKTPNIWAHALSDPVYNKVYAGSKMLIGWAASGELSVDDSGKDAQLPIGQMAHEIGHLMAGLPDLYDTADLYKTGNINEGFFGLGVFTLMADGAWGRDLNELSGTTPVSLDAWSREYLGWSVPLVPTTTGELVELGHCLSTSTAAAKLINEKASSTEYFLVENRQPTMWDTGLNGLFEKSGGWGGLLVLHIDNAVETLNMYISGRHQGVMAEHADNADYGSFGTASSLFFDGNNNTFMNDTTPSSLYYDGRFSSIGLYEVSALSEIMSFKFAKGTKDSCSYEASCTGCGNIPAAGGTGKINITTETGCPWGATSNSAWIKIESGSQGVNNGDVTFSVSATTVQRTGSITVGGLPVEISQQGDLVVPVVPIGDAVENTSLFWTTGGANNWYGQTEEFHDGDSAAMSGAVDKTQSSWLQTTVAGPADVSFYWKTASEEGKASLSFYVDGERMASISGIEAWQQKTVHLNAGNHNLMWMFSRKNEDSIARDVGWIDKVEIKPPSYYTLMLHQDGTGTGEVTSTPAGIQCGLFTSQCSADYLYGTVVTLTATPHSGKIFAGWSGGLCTGTGTCTLEMKSAQSVTATFKTPYTGTVQLPQTGQTTCWNTNGSDISCVGTGEDGELQMGMPWPEPRFTDNGDQTMTDNLTGLIWTKDGNAPGPSACSPGVTKTWQSALDYVKCLNSNSYLGYSDWRLPNVNELISVVNIGQYDNATWLNSQGFANVYYYYYWSASTKASNAGDAWVVYMSNGNVYGHDKSDSSYVWPVRGGQPSSSVISLPKTGQTTCYDASGDVIICAGTGQDGELQKGAAWPEPRFTDNGDQTMTDNLTGLIWTKDGNAPGPSACSPGVTKSWWQALDYVKCLNSSSYLGYSDWRLPNVNELKSVVNTGQSDNATWLNSQGFAIVYYSYYYWSATAFAHAFAHDTYDAWVVRMEGGEVNSYYKYNTELAWPVRGGQSGSSGSLVLSISKSGTGTGTVISSPSGINCGSSCTASYDSGTSVILTATPASGSSFAGWSGGGCSGAGTCTVTMNSAQSVTATFNSSATITLGEVLENTSATWTVGGTANWFGQSLTTHDGTDAAQSGTITDSQESWVQTTTTGAGTMSFWWGVSSESGYDELEFSIDGVVQASISGEVDWQQKTYTLTAGSHTLKWRYYKDDSASSGSDAGFVDQVVLPLSVSTLYANFTNAGVWKYSGTGTNWEQVTASNPQLLVTVGSTLYGTFPGLGIWNFNGTDWDQTTTSVPAQIVGTATTLYGAFSGLGIWQWNGTEWKQTTSSNPQKILASTSDLYGTFEGLGIWKWNGTAWSNLTTSIPDLMVTSGIKLYGAFSGLGIWLWNGTQWEQATTSNPQMIAASSAKLYGSFTGAGIWEWDGATTWKQISPDTPTQMVASGTELYAVFAGVGVKKWDGTNWSLISGNEPAGMVVGE